MSSDIWKEHQRAYIAAAPGWYQVNYNSTDGVWKEAILGWLIYYNEHISDPIPITTVGAASEFNNLWGIEDPDGNFTLHDKRYRKQDYESLLAEFERCAAEGITTT